MRVLWLIKGLGPGGAETLLASLAQAQTDDDFDYEVAYLLPQRSTLAAAIRSSGVPVHCLNAPHPIDPRWLARLCRLVQREKYDIVHTHSPLVAGMVRPALRICRPRPALVYTEHNTWDAYAPATRLLNKATYRLDDAQIAVSDAVRATIAERYRATVETILHGVPLDRIRTRTFDRERVRASLGVGSDDVLVCTVANLRREKAYADLLQAAKIVVQRAPAVRFVAVGQGPLELELRQRHAELGLGDSFQFIGYRPDAVEIIAASEMFALSSTHEGLPIALLESLAVGVAPVVTAVGGSPSAIDHGREGLLVPPSRPALLAEAIISLAHDHRRRRTMSRAAAQRAEDFDIARARGDIERTYRSVIEPQRPVSPAGRSAEHTPA